MQQRNLNTNTATTVVSSENSVNIKNHDTIGPRLVVFSSPSSRSSPTTPSSVNNIEHYYVPRANVESDRIFELGLVIFKIVSLFLQYLLIYKSEKWSGPYRSTADSFLHWHHIDQYVLGILIIFCVSLQQKLTSLQILVNLIAFLYAFWSYSWKYLLIFIYPLICSLLINHNLPKSPQHSGPVTSDSLPGHGCIPNAEDLRFETDCLRGEFNHRIRFILFSSFLTTYYICVVPLAFCDGHYIHLDIFPLVQYGFIVFLSLIMFYTSHYLPLQLLTVFHYNAQHLGSWKCLSGAHSQLIPIWDEKCPTAYDTNSVVKYKRHTFRSSELSSSVAEPGNIYHARFARLFARPLCFPLILGSIQMVLFTNQFLCLLFDQRWFVHLSQMIIFLFNTYSIHHTIRDLYLLYLVYCQG